MRTIGAILGATVAGSIAYGLYNWLLEPLVPDIAIVSVKRTVKNESGEAVVPVPYLTLDNVAAVAVIAAVAAPIGAMVHKVSGGIVPAAK